MCTASWLKVFWLTWKADPLPASAATLVKAIWDQATIWGVFMCAQSEPGRAGRIHAQCPAMDAF